MLTNISDFDMTFSSFQSTLRNTASITLTQNPQKEKEISGLVEETIDKAKKCFDDSGNLLHGKKCLVILLCTRFPKKLNECVTQ